MATPPISDENTLGPYRLLGVLGTGGMGTVYLAHDDALNRRVAIKILRSAGQADESSRTAAARARRFLREAQSAAKLNHPNVVTIHAVGKQGSTPYLVMEYVEGGSLANLLRRSGPIPWRQAASAMCDSLRGLAAAHQAGIVHRDIKPANLMLARNQAGEPVIKLADFGLARVATVQAGEEDLTFPGAFVGSPNYAAPEQIAGSLRIDGRADIYSLAAAGFALLAGQPPFVEDDPAELMDRHLNDPFPDVRSLAPTTPAEFQAILARAGEKMPENRFAGAAEMLIAVERLLHLPADIPAGSLPSSRVSAAPSAPVFRMQETVTELETRLARARQQSDSTTQLATLRELHTLYSRLDRPADAHRSFREALAVHIKMRTPHFPPQNN